MTRREQDSNLRHADDDFEMTVRLTAFFGALDSGGLTAIAIAEPNVQRARQDSNLRALVSSSSSHASERFSGPFSEMTVRLTAPFGALYSGGLPAIAIAEPNVQRARQDSNL